MTSTHKRQKERIQWLLQFLQEKDKIHLQDAAKYLNVWAMTLRRDLPMLLLGGYIVLESKNSATCHYQISEQHRQHAREKKRLAQLALPLIKDKQTLFFDCGTTKPYIISGHSG